MYILFLGHQDDVEYSLFLSFRRHEWTASSEDFTKLLLQIKENSKYNKYISKSQ